MHGQKSVYIIPKSLPLLSEIDLLMPLFGNFRKITSFLSQHASNSLNILAGRWVFNSIYEEVFWSFLKNHQVPLKISEVRQVRQKFVKSLSGSSSSSEVSSSSSEICQKVRQKFVKFVRNLSEVRQRFVRSSSSSSQKFVKSSSNSSEAWAGGPN